MKIRTCPACGSADITLERSAGITGNEYKCKTCGYSGELIIEQDVEKQFKK